MPRIPTHTVATAPEQSREPAARFEKRMGRLMNIHAGMAHSPVVIGAYEGLGDAIRRLGTFDGRTRETIALAVAGENGCEYCQSAHTVAGRRAGLSDDEMVAIRAGRIDFDDQLATLAAVVRAIAQHTGYVPDEIWNAAISAGWTEEQLTEAFAHVAANLYTNYFNHFAGTELDVPLAPPLPEF